MVKKPLISLARQGMPHRSGLRNTFRSVVYPVGACCEDAYRELQQVELKKSALWKADVSISRNMLASMSIGIGSKMAEDIDPTKALMTAKEKLVEERRALAVTIALGYRRRRTDDPHTNETREAFIGIQNLIDAVDRELVQEKQISSDQAKSFAVPIQSSVAL